ncbi:transposase [Micromonospora sp. LOL_015]|uniref:IS701 family transposase n=1 Tax=Micromonospora sp. LOL_015 TaxID=3345416 RepID=UPI003A8BD7D7
MAWVVDDTGFPKDGRNSPSVARQYSGTLGKVANCQIGVSVHAVTDTASCPLDWRLFLPASWDDHTVDEAGRPEVAARRGRCGIPEGERHRPKWALVVEMLDELATYGLRPPLVAADAGYGDNSQFRRALDQRGIGYIMQVRRRPRPHAAGASRAAGMVRAGPSAHPYGAALPEDGYQSGRARSRGRTRGRGDDHLAGRLEGHDEFPVRVPSGASGRAPGRPRS